MNEFGFSAAWQTAQELKPTGNTASESLLPLWGPLFGQLLGSCPLIVEGKVDANALKVMSTECTKAQEVCLQEDLVVLPGGGDSLVYLARALSERNVVFLVLLDGDAAGLRIKKNLVDLCGPGLEARIVTLADLGLATRHPTIESMFSLEFEKENQIAHRGLSGVLNDARRGGTMKTDDDTLSNFEKLFEAINNKASH